MVEWHLEKHTPTRGLTFEVSERIYKESSPYQTIEILQTPDFGLVMLLDGIVMVTEKDEFVYHEMLTHPALFTHANPEHVLIIGGGDGGTLTQVLKHPSIKKAVLVEIDEMVVRVSKKYFPSLSATFEHPKADIKIEDGITYLKKTENTFDIILIDSTDPVGPAEGLFHKEFYTDCFNALKPNGILTIQSESPWIPHLQPVIRKAHHDLKSLFPIVMPYTAAIQTYQAGLWLFQMASKNYHPLQPQNSIKPDTFEFHYYNQSLHFACFSLPTFIYQLLED